MAVSQPLERIVMKSLHSLSLALAALAGLACGPAQAQVDVGVSIGIQQPGVYGRIDIGNTRPPVVYAEPIVVMPAPNVIRQRPVYLYVPPGHQKNWRKHCQRYDACGQPVYFVQEQWIVDRHESREGRDEHHGKKDHGKGRGHGHD